MVGWQSILQPPLNLPRCTHDFWNIDWNLVCLRILWGSILVFESLISTLWTARIFATHSRHSKKIRSWHRHYKRSKQIESVLSWKSALPHSAFSAWPTLSRGETIAFCMTHDQPQRLPVKLGERWVSTKIQSNMFIKFLFDALHMLAPDRGDPPCHFRSEKLWCIPWYSRKSAQWSAAKQFFVMSSWCWARTHLNSIGRRIEATKKWSELNVRAQTAKIGTRKPGSQSIGNFNQSI